LTLLKVTDKELVRDTLQGKEEAFNLLVGRWQQKLYNYACRLTGDREEAFDICQESFIKAYEQLQQLKDPGKFSFWLFRIARNFSISRYRSARPHLKLDRVEDSEEEGLDLENLLEGDPAIRLDNGHSYSSTELRLMVERAMDQLPFEQRETIVLKIYEGLKFAEIAEVVDCPVSTVKSRLYLGMVKLRDVLGIKLDSANEESGRS
jgi:RNA polymerase sigma-70 factor, ECF subfamily